jgi:hypothetical protein
MHSRGQSGPGPALEPDARMPGSAPASAMDGNGRPAGSSWAPDSRATDNAWAADGSATDNAGTAELAVVELGDDPFSDDLAAQLAAREPRHVVTRTTAILAGVVLALGGFAAGAQVQKSYGTPSAAAQGAGQSSAANAGQGQGAGNSGGQGQGRGANPRTGASSAADSGQDSAAVIGTVKLVNGTTVYVETSTGQVLTVRTSGSTTVLTTQPASLSDLAAGTTVTVEGARAGETITATKVTRNR